MEVAALPQDHLFRLVYRRYNEPLRLVLGGGDAFHDLRRPVDWNAVLERLLTPQGRSEVREWVRTDDGGNRLFLHQLCYFDFGQSVEFNPEEEHWPPIVAIDTETSVLVVQRAIEAYPEAVRLHDGRGYWPLHIVCHRNLPLTDGSSASLTWHPATFDVFRLLFHAWPEAAGRVTSSDGTTALHCTLQGGVTHREESELAQRKVFEWLLEVFPQACEMPDINGDYPLHSACHGHMLDAPDMLKLINTFPRAAEKRGWFGRTPLQQYLRCCHADEAYPSGGAIELLLDACPWAASIDDESQMELGQGLDPSGDALDYICAKHCENVGVDFHEFYPDDEMNEVADVFRKGYIQANIKFLANRGRHTRGALWGFLLTVLRTMSAGGACFLPVHTFVQWRLCRPWHLVVMDGLLTQFKQDAGKCDSRGNLPLHLFLESCIVERTRAISRGYAGDDSDYGEAVKRCLQLILDANPRAASQLNGSGLLPFHIAVKSSCCSLPCDAVLDPLLSLAPRALVTRDMHSRLYPFAMAAVGEKGTVDTVYHLLRRDPSVLGRSIVAS